MSDIKLFRIANGQADQLMAESATIERSLQLVIESHLQALLGVHFLGTEHSTGRKHGGRIDTIGIDENGAPVIIEYKRAVNENVINQGLFYLDWLMDHQGDFQVLVMNKLGSKAAEEIAWDDTRLLCIAGDFTKYDLHAVGQINRNIELIRYKRYGDDLLLLELVNSVQATTSARVPTTTPTTSGNSYQKPTPMEVIEKADEHIRDLYDALKSFALGLGDDVQIKPLKMYIAFRRIKNFMCVEPHPMKGTITLFLKVDPKTVELREGFTRDVSEIGHYGTGDLEVSIGSREDLEAAQPLIMKSYEAS